MARSTPRPSHQRLTDGDRDAALDRLADHYAAGRLDKDEFDERSDAVWTARTGADLAPIFADLQPRASAAPRRPRPGRWRHRSSLPLAPVLVLVIALAVITSIPVVLLVLLGFLLVSGRHGRC